MMSVKKPNGSSLDPRFPPVPGWKFKEERLRTVTEIRAKLQALTAEMNLWGFHYTEIFCVRFAIGEALHNAIEHGHRGDETKTVQFNYLISADYVLAEIIDEGPGFDPKSIPNPFAAKQQAKPARRGLFFMSLFMSWVRFEGKGNRVTMCKMRSPSIGGFGRSDN
jgi:serine/threonine-protein kinase RsbW